ncbi:MAG: hypothetical protein L3K26_11390, partial [Candidatus Hydrogenedentes bacterium]|nr:hypothetical protein [Candidatus Hydrogenedentota bacterium]
MNAPQRVVVGLVIGLCMFLGSGVASATLITEISPDQPFDINPLTTYTFGFDNLAAPTPFSLGELVISETNGDFNGANETVSVFIDGFDLGTHTFATDNLSLLRTLQLDFTIAAADLLTILADGMATVSVTTSAGGDQSAHVWSNNDILFNASLSYDAQSATAHVPAPA